MTQFETVDEYIAAQPKEIELKLDAIRKIVKEDAPEAAEKISYRIPYYSLNGRLLYFAAQSHHIGIYAMPSAIRKFTKELEPYSTSKATIRFQYDKPLPVGLIRKIVKFRVKENLQK